METNENTLELTSFNSSRFVRQAMLTQVLYQESVKAAFEANGNTLQAPQAELIHMLVKDFAALMLTPHNNHDNVDAVVNTLHSLARTKQMYAEYITHQGKQVSMELK